MWMVILVISLVVTYLYIDFETCFLNGGAFLYPYPRWTCVFYHWYWQIIHQLPFIGKRYRDKWATINEVDKEWSDALFMPIRTIMVNIFMPFGPTIIYLLWS